MVEKKRDTGRTSRPGTSKKGDSAKARKVSAKVDRADSGERKGRSARRPATDDEDEGGEDAAPPRRGGMTAGKALLLCTPITMILLLAVGYKLAMMPDASETKKEIVIDYGALIEVARGKYVKAKAGYEDGTKQEGAAGVPKLEEARSLIQGTYDKELTTIKDIDAAKDLASKNVLGAKQLIEWVRNQVEDPMNSAKGTKVQNYEFEDLDNNCTMLLNMIRKAILERK